MTIVAPRLTDFEDPRQKFLLNQFMSELRDMAFKLTFLDSDGGTTDGRKAYNFDAVWVAYVSNGSADTEDTVSHNLDRIPLGMLIGVADKTGTVYDSGTTWTTANIFLKADVATLTVNLLVF